MLSNAFCDSTVLMIRPFRASAEANGRFRITRRGGETSILVKEVGYRACCLLGSPLKVSELRSKLAAMFKVQPDVIDLTQLFKALQTADLVRSIDGQRLPEKNPPGLRSVLNYWYRWHLVGWMEQRVSYLSSNNSSYTLAYVLTYISTHFNYSLKATKAASNFIECASSRCPARVGGLRRYKFQARYIHHLTKNALDFHSLMSLSPAGAEQWLAKHVTYSGLEHLERAQKLGCGVIISAFHFNVTKLIPFLLMRKGFSVTQVAVPDSSTNVNAFAEWVTRFADEHPGYGEYRILSDFGVKGFRNLAGLLANNGIAVWLPDIYFDKSASLPEHQRTEMRQVVDERTQFLGIKLFDVQLPRSKFKTDLMGKQVLMNGWAGAFASTTGSAVLPAALSRKGDKLCLSMYPPLFADRARPKHAAEQLNTALFAQLDSLVTSKPEQWFGWHSLIFANSEEPVGT